MFQTRVVWFKEAQIMIKSMIKSFLKKIDFSKSHKDRHIFFLMELY